MADHETDGGEMPHGSPKGSEPGDRPAPIRWMSTTEAAEFLGVTLRTLYRFIDSGDLAAFKFGRVIRLRADDVETFIEASRIAPGSLDHLYPDTRARAADVGRSQSPVET